MKLSSISPPADQVFRALSDATRLRLLNLLRVHGETCVCDLVDVLDVPQPKVSRHLAYLRRAGLVVARKDGLWMHYRLARATTGLQRSVLKCVESCTESMPAFARDARLLKKSRCVSTECCE